MGYVCGVMARMPRDFVFPRRALLPTQWRSALSRDRAHRLGLIVLEPHLVPRPSYFLSVGAMRCLLRRSELSKENRCKSRSKNRNRNRSVSRKIEILLRCVSSCRNGWLDSVMFASEVSTVRLPITWCFWRWNRADLSYSTGIRGHVIRGTELCPRCIATMTCISCTRT